MKVKTSYNNFSRGKIDHDLMGRFDLPLYSSGADKFDNFYSNFKGNAIFRAGLQDMIGSAFQDCAFYEFKFSNSQSYIIVAFNGYFRFLSYDGSGTFGWVLDGSSNILEVASPYNLAQSKTLCVTQNADVMIITCAGLAPRELKRVSANNFTLAAYTYTGGPINPYLCLFYKGRLYFARTALQPTTIWGSETGDFDAFVIPGTVTAVTPLQFTPSEIAQPIEWLFGGDNSLVCGSSDGVIAVNGGGVGDAITAESIEATLTSSDGVSPAVPLKKDGKVFYVGRNRRNIYSFSYDLLTESFVAKDANFISYDITDGLIKKIRWKKDKDDLIWSLDDAGNMLSLNYNEPENIVGWARHTTNGTVKDIASITDNEGNPQLFALVLRGSSYFIEKLADRVEFVERVDFFTSNEQEDEDAYRRMISEQLKQCVYVDGAVSYSNLSTVSISYNSGTGQITAASSSFSAGDVGKHITYKTVTGYEFGRFVITAYVSATVVSVNVLQEPSTTTYALWYKSFSTLSGLSQFNGQSVSVVSDGGYLSDFTVSGGEIDFTNQVNSVVIGYKYAGVVKSFSLGFANGAEQTQATFKAISRVGFRCVASAGIKFGTTRYRLEPLQDINDGDLNYLPPAPIDGTKYLSYSDDNERDKFFFVVQDEPLPCTITCVIVEANY